MHEITEVEDLKAAALVVLKAVHDFCVKNEIHYFLCFGTLIGAIRHNGFIPWDDDIDIAMPRADYNRFVETFHLENFDVYSCETKENYPYSFAKAFDKRTQKVEPIYTKGEYRIGIDVDIFPVDNFRDLSRCESFRRRLLCNLLFSSVLGKVPVNSFRSFVKRVLYCGSRLFRLDANRFARKLNISANFPETGKFMIYSDSISKKPAVFKGDCLKEYILHSFENMEFFIPIGYDEILRNIYGDYMQLPPEEKRVTHHSFRAYVNDEVFDKFQ